MGNINIVSLFFDKARLHPDRTALVSVLDKCSFGELANEVQQCRNYFESKGIGPGDRVLVFVPMGFDLYRTVLALFSMGAVAVFLDEWVSFPRLSVCCRMAKCKAFIAPWYLHVPGWFSADVRAIPVHLTPLTSFQHSSETVDLFPAKSTDPALITFTTGSTGIPKAANRTHGFLMAQFEALKTLIENDLEVDMPMLPIVLLLNLAVGKTSVIADFKSSKPKRFRPEKVLRQLLDHKVESLIASPFFLVEMAKESVRSTVQIPTLKKILSGGGPVFPDDAKWVARAFPEAEFTVVFGSTEAEPIAHISASVMMKEMMETADPMKGLLVGNPDPSVEWAIIPIQDGIVTAIQPLGSGIPGELVVTGNHVLDAYIDNPEATRLNKIIVQGKVWHRTGDAASVEKDGTLWLLGRCQGRVWIGERLFFPFQVEYALQTLSPSRSGTLISLSGMPVLVLQSGSTDIPTHILKNWGLDSVSVSRVSSFPMDKRHHTKIDYASLKEMLDR